MNIDQEIEFAVQTLCKGGLVVFPTETVFGIGADAVNPEAVDRIFQVKKRPRNHPLIVHVPSILLAKKIIKDWPEMAEKIAKKLWPGPITLVLKKNNFLSDIISGGQDTIAVRMPSNPIAKKLLHEFSKKGSGLIVAPSANIFGSVSNTSFFDVNKSIGNRLTDKDFILDGEGCFYGVESTIVDLTNSKARILRPGSVSKSLIESSFDIKLSENDKKCNAPTVSGSSLKHYSPNTPLYVLARKEMVLAVKKRLLSSSKNFFFWGFSFLPITSGRLHQQIAPLQSFDY
ncbi:MAG: threonylcarbamoyl-AMP synthase, partial [Candidatus Pelagibacter sp.]|nr:threonylcarbamoyl-AMP synthase [Candidatus Pelagibacter sp.]